MLRIAILCFILLLIDAYTFKGISLLISNLESKPRLIIQIMYWAISFLVIGQMVNIFSHWQEYRIARPEFVRFWMGVFFVLFFSKFGFIIFHLLDDVFFGLQKAISYVGIKMGNENATTISRGKFLTQIGLGVSGLLLGAYTYGVVSGRYAFRIVEQKMNFSNLPKAFDGLRIVQISDLHLGSFIKDFEQVSKAIAMVNDLKPDLLFFTGDMVNVHSDEAEPWIDIFSKLKAKHGKYSIFGNHDYCDYGSYSKPERAQSISRLKEIHKEMGFHLMEDEHRFIELSGEKIALIGMHNWGKGFHQMGSLEKAISGLDDNEFQILLSHDPTLWEEKVKDKKNIDLTLSGHTHGMQMGVEIPALGIKWSPVKLRYKRWAGLYTSGKNHLYINRGFGFLGFPGRVGIPPEITLIELKKEAS